METKSKNVGLCKWWQTKPTFFFEDNETFTLRQLHLGTAVKKTSKRMPYTKRMGTEAFPPLSFPQSTKLEKRNP